MNSQTTNLVFGFVGVLAAVFVIGKMISNKPAPVTLSCPVVPSALSDEVKAYIDVRLKGQHPTGSAADIDLRLQRIEKAIADARASGLSARDLSGKISDFEKFLRDQRASGEGYVKEKLRTEFLRLRNTMIHICRPKGAPPDKPL